MTRDTKVSKTNPAIKKILEATLGSESPGASIVVREVPPTWEHTEYIDDKTKAWYLNLATLFGSGQVRVHSPERPRYGGPSVVHPAPQSHEALVHLLGRSTGRRSVEIILREDAIDSAAVAVATDALLTGNKKAALQAAGSCDKTAGICLALAEANAKALGKGERGETGKTKRSAAQLDREIAAALSRR